jgi:hypothetical protein
MKIFGGYRHFGACHRGTWQRGGHVCSRQRPRSAGAEEDRPAIDQSRRRSKKPMRHTFPKSMLYAKTPGPNEAGNIAICNCMQNFGLHSARFFEGNVLATNKKLRVLEASASRRQWLILQQEKMRRRLLFATY